MPTPTLSYPSDDTLLDQSLGPRALDLAFGDFLRRLDPELEPSVRLAGILVSRRLNEGHTCLELAQFAGRASLPGLPGAPLLDAWLDTLRASALVAEPGKDAPLVLDGGRLYLHRYWRYETDIAVRLSDLMAKSPAVDEELLRDGLRRLFADSSSGTEADRQQIAAALALLKSFALISGGPGTGKTYTVTRILALLMEQSPDEAPRIALAAPTGKARARLADSIETALSTGLPCSEPVISRIREAARNARTLHGLLGAFPGRSRSRYHSGHLLPYDVVVVDEASMIDLPMMARLLRALPESGRLILLGDRNQLPPVEVGALLGDLCAAAGDAGYSAELSERLQVLTGRGFEARTTMTGPLIRDSLAELRKPRRFAAGSGIAAMAEAIQRGESEACAAVLRESEDMQWHKPASGEFEPWLADIVRDAILPCLQAVTVAEALARYGAFRILCVLRQGGRGGESVNPAVESILSRLTASRYGLGEWYRGRPVMITRNDPALGLNNGDIGITWPDPESGQALRVFFPNERGPLKAFSPARLPAHETVYAMTVHKSQGSEFEHVHLILPDHPVPLLSRELIYTAVTRAKSRLNLYGSEAVLGAAIARRMERGSGLHARLGGG
ncbi:exodeoxyribonuclease V subunit alpha [Methylococcus sp. EFPC2]|uniref:exodeoxyribonuclease V subunit alpha n=1 Tax=Methylococcus sp. EFPC2 TaxID=2812648 RepID=UPI00196756E8|nr:exodeoxyribonuclease V subunit alpha [Methylococcus sp. EFPC2]QSA95680.1 exodeoxyribonuclease V subunit alpha [Methylococcus sp. EFPC2]